MNLNDPDLSLSVPVEQQLIPSVNLNDPNLSLSVPVEQQLIPSVDLTGPDLSLSMPDLDLNTLDLQPKP